MITHAPDAMPEVDPTPSLIASDIASDVENMTVEQKVRLFLNVLQTEAARLAEIHGIDRAEYLPQSLVFRRYQVFVEKMGFPKISPKRLTMKLVAAGCKRKRLNDAARTTVIELPGFK